MKNEKKLGIWMDHSKAHLMELIDDSIETTVIESTFTFDVKNDSLSKSEKLMHNKQQQQQMEFYKKLMEVIIKYDNVILFGATDAIVELYNILKVDNHFNTVKINIEKADRMTDNQEKAYVKRYFSNYNHNK